MCEVYLLKDKISRRSHRPLTVDRRRYIKTKSPGIWNKLAISAVKDMLFATVTVTPTFSYHLKKSAGICYKFGVSAGKDKLLGRVTVTPKFSYQLN